MSGSPETFRNPRSPRRAPDIRKLAQRQRWMIWLILVSLVTQCVPVFAGPLGTGSRTAVMAVGFAVMILLVIIHVLMVVGVVLLLAAKGTHIAVIVLCGILMFAPCVNLLVLLLVNARATRTLRQAGLHVGLLGVDPEELERVVNPILCSHCGYNLTGNVSGYCPECGANLPV